MGHASCIRRCAACGRRAPADALLRFVAGDEGPEADPQRRRGGRGAHLCPRRACAQQAARRFALHRVLRLRPPPKSQAGTPDERAQRLLEEATQALGHAVADAHRRCLRRPAPSSVSAPLGKPGPDVIDPSVLARPGRAARRLRGQLEQLRGLTEPGGTPSGTSPKSDVRGRGLATSD